MPASTRHGGRHRKPRGAKHARSARRTVRPLGAAAGAALVGASLVTAGPAAAAATPTPHALRVANEELRLAAAANILNVPINLAIDIMNVPYNEVAATDFFARSLLFTGPWFVVSPTNLWGVDPGDPGHFQSTVNFALPFPALNGMNLAQNDQNGLGQQLWMFVAATLPVSTSCDVQSCTPQVPTSPITGVTSIDSLIWIGAIATGQLQLPLISNWFKVSLGQMLDGYDFSTSPGATDPSGPVFDGFGFEGTTGADNAMPWADQTFVLDPFKPFVNYMDHLMADPAGNPIQIPSFEQIGRAFQAALAGLVMDFDPITAGSPFCPGDCSDLPDALDYPGLVKSISDAWPGNPLLDGPDGWLTKLENGTANVPTQEQIDRAIEILQQKNFFDFQNPSPPAEWSPNFNLSSLAPVFHKMWKDFGFDVPDLNTEVDDGSDSSATQLRAAAVEKTPQTATPVTPPADTATPSPAEATPSPVDATLPAQGGGLTPPKGLDSLLPHWKRTPKADTTSTETGGASETGGESETGGATGGGQPWIGSTGAHPGTPPRAGDHPLRNLLKKITGEKPGGATDAGASDKASSSGAGSGGGTGSGKSGGGE
jgi:hypothetical protein